MWNFLNLDIVYVRNRGFIFGILSSSNNKMLLLFISFISILTIMFLIGYLLIRGRSDIFYSICLSFIIGGAIGNIWDRITKGYVIDFIDVYIKDCHWPAFNIADSFITIGIILLVIDIIRR